MGLMSSVLEMKIRAEGLTKRFGNRQVVEGINLELKKGEIVGLLGKNGAGKTVLMNMLTGMMLPDSGTIKYSGKNIEKNIHRYWEKINWASAYQSLQLQASIRENMETYAGIYGVGRKMIEEVLEMVDVTDEKILNKKMYLLSSGEVGKVNLAKALLNKPEILFLDEPTAFLDPLFKVRLIKILSGINKKWKTSIIFSSHQLDEVIKLADKVMVLRSGKMAYSGKVLSINKLINFY